MFILYPSGVNTELYKERYKHVLPTEGKEEDSRRGTLQCIHKKQTFNKIKMSPIAIQTS